MNSNYLNSAGYEIPKDTILIVPSGTKNDGFYQDIIMPLNGVPKRDWFSSHFYYCLPILIGSQYGFIIKSLRDFTFTWDGTERNANIKFLNNDNQSKQMIQSQFGQGIITVQNMFSIRTPPGINIMTIQPPNLFIPGCFSLTGVIETDQIRRDFTFNFKVTVPNIPISVKKGDALGAFIPIPRGFVDNFKINHIYDFFDKEIHENEIREARALGLERATTDKAKPHQSGRRYFNGIHSTGEKYPDHQKRLV